MLRQLRRMRQKLLQVRNREVLLRSNTSRFFIQSSVI